MKAWHVVAAVVGVGAAIYLYRSTGGGFASVPANYGVPPATGPASETRTGIGHFVVGVRPFVASGPAVSTRTGRGAF